MKRRNSVEYLHQGLVGLIVVKANVHLREFGPDLTMVGLRLSGVQAPLQGQSVPRPRRDVEVPRVRQPATSRHTRCSPA